MIDHLLGRPNPSWKRLQVFFVVFFWLWRILHGNPDGPRILWIRRANRLLKQFTPWQLVVSTLTGVYAVRNIDKILGLGSPEPLANLYSPSYYRATWINTGLDAGFATALSIRPKWLRDICSILFSVYYIIYATEADEKLRRFRAVPTVEMLRATWEKTTNPYIRALSRHPPVTIRRKLVLPRPSDSAYQRPITAWLFFASPEHHLARATELILDFPGGGFISMTPEHHEDRLRMWAVRTGKPVLSIEYGKAPEYPYPFAIDECFDVYRTLVECAGRLVGMSGSKFDVVFSGDSAGAHIAVAVMIKILETQLPVPHPLAMQLNYAALDFNFTSWMSPDHLRVLQSEQSSGHLSGLAEQKDHFKHISPLSMVGDRKVVRRRRSWRDTLRVITSPVNEKPPSPRALRSGISISSPKAGPHSAPVKSHGRMYTQHQLSTNALDEAGSLADEEDGADLSAVPEEDKPIQARVRFNPVISQQQLQQSPKESEDDATLVSLTDEPMPLGTRLTMTSRTGYFQDRVISPSMMRAMAILFIGPHRNPDFAHDYHLSPVLAPSRLLAQFPPLLMTCGEKDPFVDDTVIFAGRVREAKRARRKELEAALTGRTAMFGEHLRMSLHDNGRDDASLRAMKRELDELAGQTEEDWVQMHIFSEWSHGYMQMSRLMPEACTVITDLADWIDGVFESRRGRSVGRRSSLSKGRVAKLEKAGLAATDDVSTPFASETEVETETDDPLTFAPKKRSPPSSFSTSRDSRDPLTPTSRPRQSSRGTSSKRPMDWQDGGVAETVNNAIQPGSVSVTQDILHGTAIAFSPATGGSVARVVSPVSAQRLPSPTRNGKAASPAKAGQKISESELMRRRRLLDSHLISSDSPPR